MKKPLVSHLWLCSCSLVHLLSACRGWGLVNRFEIQGIGRVLKLFSTFAILFLRNNNTYHEHQDILKCALLTVVSRPVRLDFSVDIQWKMRCLCVPCYPYAIVFLPHVKKNSVRSCWRLVEPLHLVPWGTKMWEKQENHKRAGLPSRLEMQLKSPTGVHHMSRWWHLEDSSVTVFL